MEIETLLRPSICLLSGFGDDEHPPAGLPSYAASMFNWGAFIYDPIRVFHCDCPLAMRCCPSVGRRTVGVGSGSSPASSHCSTQSLESGGDRFFILP